MNNAFFCGCKDNCFLHTIPTLLHKKTYFLPNRIRISHFFRNLHFQKLICTMKGKRTNPLLQDFDNPPFDIIKAGDYLPAFRQTIAEAEAELERIIELLDKLRDL